VREVRIGSLSTETPIKADESDFFLPGLLSTWLTFLSWLAFPVEERKERKDPFSSATLA